MLQWMLLALMPIYLVTGCGDLEPEMQDTRTVILNMDFDQRSSSRTSRVDPAELINYKTHLIMVLTSEIMVLTSGKNLSNSNYWDYRSNQGEYVLYDSDREITLNMKLDTKMKIFAFLFRENYSIGGDPDYDLFSANRDAGYYGESQIITIDDRQSRIPANIILNQVSGTDPAGGDFGGDPGDFGEGTDPGGGTDNGTDTGTGTGTGTSTIGIVNFDQGVEYMTACTTSYPSNTRKSVKFLSANTLEYTISPVTYQNASDCTNKVNGTRTAYSFIFNYATTPTYTVSNQEGQTGLTAYYGTWALSSSPSSPTYWMLIYPKDTNEFWIGFGTDESSAKALNMLYGGDGSSIDNKYTK